MRRANQVLALLLFLCTLFTLAPQARAETLTSSLTTLPALAVYPADGSRFEIRVVLRFNESKLRYFYLRYSASSALTVHGFRTDDASISHTGSALEVTYNRDKTTGIVIAVDCSIQSGATADQSFSISSVIGRPSKTTMPTLSFPNASKALPVPQAPTCSHPAWQVKGDNTATCTSSGTQAYACVDCGEQKKEATAALGHAAYWEMVAAGDCMHTGREALLCERCDAPAIDYRDTPILPHGFSDNWEVVDLASCTVPGLKKRSCNFGLHIEQAAYGGDGHQYGPAEGVSVGDCLTEGSQKETCASCGDERFSGTGLGPHTPSAWVTLPEATCTQPGTRQQHCSLCGDLLHTETIQALEHDFMAPVYEPLDCEAAERVAISQCGRCPYRLEEPAPPMEHLYVRTIVPAQCGKDGLESWRCSRCAVTGQVILPAKQHVFTAYTIYPVPDCINQGRKTATCINCGDKDVVELGTNEWHDYSGAWITTCEPSCMAPGERTIYCKRCQKPYSEVLSQLKHSYGDWVNGLGYSCHQGGTRSRQCMVSECQHIESQLVSPGKAHEWRDWEQTTAPLCMTAGEEQRSCQLCSIVEPRMVAKRGHDYGAWWTSLEPTCSEPGERRMDCRRSGCDDSYAEKLPALRHEETQGVEDEVISCTQPRYRRFSCQRLGCDHVRQEPIEAGTHRLGDWHTTLTPGCTLAGEEQRRCELCSYAETNKLQPLKHSLSGAWYTSLEPSCTRQGERTINCARCDYQYHEPIVTLAHRFGNWQPIRHASCVAEGIQSRQCGLCGAQQTEVTVKTTHHCPTRTEVEAADCTNPGMEEGPCRYCGNTISFPMAARGHRYGTWQVTKAALCDVPGEESRQCADCDGTESRATRQLFHVYGQKTVLQAATCEQTGLSSKLCKLCGLTFETGIPATGHSYGKWEQAQHEDCTKGGVQQRHCQGCDRSESRPTKPIKHYYHAWQIVHAATCHEEGLRTRICRRCQATESQALPVRKHAYGRWTTQVAASCTAEGRQIRQCKHCPEQQERSRPLKKHWAGKWQIGKAAQLDTPGEKWRLCRRCGTVMARKAYTLPRSSFAVSFCALGLPLSELQQDSSSKAWYMLTPIDVSRDGAHTYPLIADNSHCIGQVRAVVAEGHLTISYSLYAESTELLKPSLRIFLTTDQLTDRDIASRRGQRKLDQGINIARNLKGAKLVFMSLRLEGLYKGEDPLNRPYAADMAMPEGEGTCGDALDAMRDLVKHWRESAAVKGI